MNKDHWKHQLNQPHPQPHIQTTMDRSRSPSISRPHPPPQGQGRSTSPLWDESPSPRIPSPSRGRPRSYHARAPSESRSRSRYSSRSSSVSSSRSRKTQKKHQQQQQHDHHKGLFKTSAGLLAGIGVATFLAHKVWPKGVIYGDLEDWASKKADKAEAKQQQRRRPEPQRRTSEPHHGPPRRNHNHHEQPPPRVIERVRERGNVTYREEIVPVRKGDGRRRDLEARGFERVGARNNERANQPLPYPDRAYPDERFYGPSNSRSRPGEPVYR